MIKKGDKFIWHGQVTIEVTRVAKDEAWADVIASGPHGNSWSKRMALPLDDKYVKVSDG